MRGYTPETKGCDDIDYAFIHELSEKCPAKIIAEGHIHYPEQAKKSVGSGSICPGSRWRDHTTGGDHGTICLRNCRIREREERDKLRNQYRAIGKMVCTGFLFIEQRVLLF